MTEGARVSAPSVTVNGTPPLQHRNDPSYYKPIAFRKAAMAQIRSHLFHKGPTRASCVW